MQDELMTHRVLKIHLSSWRYMAMLTLPPLYISFQIHVDLIKPPLLLLFIITHYYCWRLYLDEELFKLLEGGGNLVAFDNALKLCWRKRKCTERTVEQRWQATAKLFYRARLAFILLWVVSFLNV